MGNTIQLLENFGFTVEQKGKTLFMLNKSQTGGGLFNLNGVTYPVWVPVSDNNGRIYYNDKTRMVDSYVGVLSRDIKAGEILDISEVAYINEQLQEDSPKNILGGYGYLLNVLKPTFNGWVAKRDITLAKDLKKIDDAAVYTLSEISVFELIRGLYLDSSKFGKPGWIGFRATNGALLSLLARHDAVTHREDNKLKQYSETIRFNRPIGTNEASNFVDLANVPQSEEAIKRLTCNENVTIVNNRFSLSENMNKYSYLLNGTPLRSFMNQKRLLVQRTSQSALNMSEYEYPYLYVDNSNNIHGRNAISYRDSTLAGDTFHVSKSFAKNMLGYKEIERYFIVPANTKIKPEAISQKVSREEIMMGLKLGVASNKVRKTDTLFTYTRQKLGTGLSKQSSEIQEKYGHLYKNLKDEQLLKQINNEIDMEILKHNIEANKEVIAEYGLEFTPTGWSSYDANAPGGNVTMVRVTGIQVTSLKVGSKMIDRYGNKGTVAKVIDDSLMPHILINDVEIPVDIMYNPTIYKRKIGLAFKTEELLALDASIHDLDGTDIALLDGTETLKDIKSYLSAVPHSYKLRIGDKIHDSFKVGIHYMYHLDHDPERKFNLLKGSKISFIDRIWFKKMGFDIKTPLTSSMDIARSLGYKLEIKPTLNENMSHLAKLKLKLSDKSIDNIPVLVKLEDDNLESVNYISIRHRLNRDLLRRNLYSLSQKDIESTVADPLLDTKWGKIPVFNVDLWIPPGLIRSFVTNTGKLVLPDELITLNAILSEIHSIKHLKLNNKDYTIQGKKLKKLVSRYETEMLNRLNATIRSEYFPRISAARGVVVNNDDLSIDEIGIPRKALKYFQKKGLNTKYGIVKRHPVHRLYNMPIVRFVPVDGYAFQANEQLMDLLDGDTDGDLVEIIPLHNRKPSKYFTKYKPSVLLLGHTDIKTKKKTRRELLTSLLSYDQHDLKRYTAISGALAIKLINRALTVNYGFTQVAQLYHFMAQTSLDFKHIRRNIKVIDDISTITNKTLYMKPTANAVNEFKKSVKQLYPIVTRKQLNILSYVFVTRAHIDLDLIGKSLSAKRINQLLAG